MCWIARNFEMELNACGLSWRNRANIRTRTLNKTMWNLWFHVSLTCVSVSMCLSYRLKFVEINFCHSQQDYEKKHHFHRQIFVQIFHLAIIHLILQQGDVATCPACQLVSIWRLSSLFTLFCEIEKNWFKCKNCNKCARNSTFFHVNRKIFVPEFIAHSIAMHIRTACHQPTEKPRVIKKSIVPIDKKHEAYVY